MVSRGLGLISLLAGGDVVTEVELGILFFIVPIWFGLKWRDVKDGGPYMELVVNFIYIHYDLQALS